MCMFTKANMNTDSEAYRKGVERFDCGYCPECLSKRSKYWALRCSMEAKVSHGIMVTLTYDQIVRDEDGNIVIDPKTNLPMERVDTRPCSVRDCQLFIKRLRDHFKDRKVKYMLCAEHGSTTGRSHYHAILFNVDFPDRVFHKRSKRGNRIYRSRTLNEIWKHGICTIDSVCIGPRIARYCTKYCAKERGQEDTFMLASQGIGEEYLQKKFNGKYYMLDGYEYTIPRQIWNKYILNKYRKIDGKGNDITEYFYTYKYRNLQSLMDSVGTFLGVRLWKLNYARRKKFMQLKECDIEYQSYIEYWKSKAEAKKPFMKSDFERVLALPDDKYHNYKFAVIRSMNIKRIREDMRVSFPGLGWKFIGTNTVRPPRKPRCKTTCRKTSCHNTASDSIKNELRSFFVNKTTGEVVKLTRIEENLTSPF